MKYRFIAFAATLLACFHLPLSAESVMHDNAVYHITNVQYGYSMLPANGTGNIAMSTTTDNTDPAQLWLTECNPDGTGYYLRNYLTGHYMKSPLKTGTYWTASYALMPDKTSMLMNIDAVDNQSSSVFIYPQSILDRAETDDARTRGYAHNDGSKRLVSWGSGTNASKWNISLCDGITASDIAERKATWNDFAPTVSEIEPGRVYRIVNVGYGRVITETDEGGATTAVATDDNSKQLWLVEYNADSTAYIIRNLETGKALRSSMSKSGVWSLQNHIRPDRNSAEMYIDKLSNGFTIAPLSTKGKTDEASLYGFAHEDAGGKLVCWASGPNGSRWYFALNKDITEADIEAKRQQWECTAFDNLEKALAHFFDDSACSIIKTRFNGWTEQQLEGEAQYALLPDLLKQMVRKACAGDWTETDPVTNLEWDSAHAKRFRIQSYEPYSQTNQAASLLGILPYSNVNNPTGIVTDNGTTLYVMVDQEPRDGSRIFLRGHTGTGVGPINNLASGFELHKGLNIINCTEDVAHMYVYYFINGSDGRKKLMRVSDFDDITIHIEGGSLNGYFDSVGDKLKEKDTNEDWLYYRERARHPMFDFMSERMILHLHLFDVVNSQGATIRCTKSVLSPSEYAAGRFDLNHTMDDWDRLMLIERLVVGAVTDDEILAEKAAGRDYYDLLADDDLTCNDYPEYFNNRLMGITIDNGLMFATNYRISCNYKNIDQFIKGSPSGRWTCAHEVGHVHQNRIRLAGTTEISNNLFSNIAVFYAGREASRTDYPSEQRRVFYEGKNFYQNSAAGMMRMYFQLWLYYHATGHNKHFYPRLFELLRDNPLRRTSSTHLEVKYDLLHFAKMCCVAAQEDLTDFFDAWGCFVEMDGFPIVDNSTNIGYLTADDIREWKEDVARMAAENNWPRNRAIMFIDDRVGSNKPVSGGYDRTKCGTLGGLKDYAPGAHITGEYQFTITDNVISFSGATGAVGFAIYDKEGKLLAFANENSFEVPDNIAQMIINGETEVVVADGSNNSAHVADIIREGGLQQKIATLGDLVSTVSTFLAKTDTDETNVNYLHHALVPDLQAAYDEAVSAIDNGEVTDDSAVSLYVTLGQRYLDALNIPINDETAVHIRPGCIYVFTNNYGSTKVGLKANAAGTQLQPVAAGDINPEDEAQQWRFEPAATEGMFYIRNVKCGKYIGRVYNDGETLILQDEPEPYAMARKSIARFALLANGDDKNSIHSTGSKITRAVSDNNGSHWSMSMCDNIDSALAILELRTLIDKAEKLMATAGKIDVTTSPVPLTASCLYSNAPYTATNNSDKFSTWDVVLDNNSATYFHSDYSGTNSADGLNHYIRIRVPDEVTLENFSLTYRTRNKVNSNNAPTDITLACSADGETWTDIANITSGLSTASATDVTLGQYHAPEGTKYVRMMVNKAQPNTLKGGHPYFVVSEISLTNSTANDVTAVVDEAYADVVTTDMLTDLFNPVKIAKYSLVNPEGLTTDEVMAMITSINRPYEVLHAAVNTSMDLLSDLTARTRQLVNDLGTVIEELVPVKLNYDDLHSNCQYKGSGDDNFSDMSVLLDNNTNTYFHSDYINKSQDDCDHWINIKISDDPMTGTTQEETYVLTYTTHNNVNALRAPTSATIYYSYYGDSAPWLELEESYGFDIGNIKLDGNLPVTPSTVFTSEPFTVPVQKNFIWLMVHDNSDGTASAADGKKCFAISELGLYKYSMRCVLNSDDYPDITDEILGAAARQLRTAEEAVRRGDYSVTMQKAIYNALLPHYETLREIHGRVHFQILNGVADNVPLAQTGNSGAATYTARIRSYYTHDNKLTHNIAIKGLDRIDNATATLTIDGENPEVLNLEQHRNPDGTYTCTTSRTYSEGDPIGNTFLQFSFAENGVHKTALADFVPADPDDMTARLQYGEPATIEILKHRGVMKAGSLYNVVITPCDANGNYLPDIAAEASCEGATLVNGFVVTESVGSYTLSATVGDSISAEVMLHFIDAEASEAVKGNLNANFYTNTEEHLDLSPAFDDDIDSKIVFTCADTEEHDLIIDLGTGADIHGVELIWDNAAASRYTLTFHQSIAGATLRSVDSDELPVATYEVNDLNNNDRRNIDYSVATFADEHAGAPLRARYVKLVTHKAIDPAAGIGLREVNVLTTAANDDDDTPSGIGSPECRESDNKLVDVYTLTGIRLLKDVRLSEAKSHLAPGVYIIGNNKVLVK